jgi:hypothetical protein
MRLVTCTVQRHDVWSVVSMHAHAAVAGHMMCYRAIMGSLAISLCTSSWLLSC